MAKKKPANSRSAKRSNGSKKASAAVTNGSGRKKGPRSQSLPGMGQVRNQRLVHLCENLADIRAEQAKLNTQEAQDLQSALTELRAKGLSGYHHAGIELARVAGTEKIRCRVVSKDKASAAVDEDDAAGDEAGTDGRSAAAGEDTTD